MFVRLALAAALVTALPACQWIPDESSGTESDGTSAGSTGSGGTTLPDLPPPGPEDIVVATFNVHLFFDTKCDSGNCGGSNFEQVYSDAAFAARADTIAAAISGLQADIVLLQEVEKDTCIAALAARLPEYTTAYLGEKGFPASIDTALLARYPLVEIRSHGSVPIPLPSGGETYFARDFLEAHFDRDGRRVIAFVAHFKSKADDDPERRLAEAGAARDIVAAAVAAHPDALVLMGGDLNDIPGSPPLLALEDGGDLERVAADLGDNDWTFVYSGELRALDHLYLATQATGGGYVANTARVFRGKDNVGWGDSDHAALRATFRVGK
jgi:endonuclease/exonuclease/phosphatase family metal-dependent hydrolase